MSPMPPRGAARRPVLSGVRCPHDGRERFHALTDHRHAATHAFGSGGVPGAAAATSAASGDGVRCPHPRAFRREALTLALMLLGVVAVHHAVLGGWWRWDDSQILLFATRHSPWDYFFRPGQWQQLSPSNFTPLVALSFDADLGLFGLRPAGFYAHHLAVLALAAAASYGLFRRFASPLPAFAGGLLFSVGAPVAVAAQQLMTRHYLEGLLCTVGAAVFFLRAVERNRAAWAIPGACCYLLAVAAKEVFVPLPLVLLALPVGGWRWRVRCSAPFWFVLLGYVPWRFSMLGFSAGGYDHLAASWGDWIRLPWSLWRALAGGPVAGLVLLGLLALLAARLAAERPWHRLVLALTLMAAVVAPLVPVAGLVAEPGRLTVVPWWSVSLLAAFLLGRWWQGTTRSRVVAAVVWVAMTGIVALHTVRTLEGLQPQISQFEAEGRFVWEHWDRPVHLYAPLLGPGSWYHAGLLSLREPEGQVRLRVWVDPVEFRGHDGPVWSYDAACRCVRDVGWELGARHGEWEARLQDRPLEVFLSWRGNQLEWRFGPYAEGVYTLIFRYDSQPAVSGSLTLPPAGRIRSAEQFDTLRFHLQYASPEGWMTYSPELVYAVRGTDGFHWHR